VALRAAPGARARQAAVDGVRAGVVQEADLVRERRRLELALAEAGAEHDAGPAFAGIAARPMVHPVPGFGVHSTCAPSALERQGRNSISTVWYG